MCNIHIYTYIYVYDVRAGTYTSNSNENFIIGYLSFQRTFEVKIPKSKDFQGIARSTLETTQNSILRTGEPYRCTRTCV